jgi:hypothetical protein
MDNYIQSQRYTPIDQALGSCTGVSGAWAEEGMVVD